MTATYMSGWRTGPTFHHPMTQTNVVTTDYSDWATNCPEYKVTAVQVRARMGTLEPTAPG